MYINYEQTPDRISGLESLTIRITEIVLDFLMILNSLNIHS